MTDPRSPSDVVSVIIDVPGLPLPYARSGARGAVDLVGRSFGRWTVLSHYGHDVHNKVRWQCRCRCGVVKSVSSDSLTRGKSLSCGCLTREVASRLNKGKKVSAVPDAVLVESYERTQSVWQTGKEVGLCGQSVHERLQRIGVTKPIPIVTDAERERIKEYYLTTPSEIFDLTALATSMDRPKTTICREAGRLGLASHVRKKSTAASAKAKTGAQGMWTRHSHPRGMAGKTQTDRAREAVSKSSKLRWATWKAFGIGHMAPEYRDRQSKLMSGRQHSPENTYSRCKRGRRADLGEIFFRSSWEANYARYLNLLLKMKAIESWEYEPETFWFDGIKRGVMSYKPDFCIKHKNDDRLEYIELKGWVTDKDKTKWRRMAKYHPKIKLTVVKEKEYRSIARKWSSSIPAWETDKRDKYR